MRHKHGGGLSDSLEMGLETAAMQGCAAALTSCHLQAASLRLQPPPGCWRRETAAHRRGVYRRSGVKALTDRFSH